MEQTKAPVVTLCRACQGDPVASRSCDVCKGAGMGSTFIDGLLVWLAPVDDFTFAFRALKRRVTVLLHLLLMTLSLASLGWAFWHVTQADTLDAVWSMQYWMSGHPAITAFWAGIFIDCFLIFRLAEFSRDVKDLPTWGRGRRWLAAYEKSATERARHQVDVSAYFNNAAWEVIENAFGLAKNLKRAEVSLVHLFAGAMATNAGALFLTRLGLPFETLKEPLARLVGAGEGSDKTPQLSKEARRALIMAYRDASDGKRQTVTAMEIFSQVFLASPVLQELLDGLGYPAPQVVHVAEWIRLQDKLREDHARFVRLASLKPGDVMNRSMTARATPLLDRFSEDLTIAARNGHLSPLVGRDGEMEELLRAIESGRRSVILVGEPGTGKHALVEGLARRMVEEDVPEELFDRRLVSLDVPQIIGAGDPSLASERLFAVLEEVALSGNIILVLHGIDSLETSTGALDLATAFATELEKGHFIAIGTTSPRAYVERLERRPLGARMTRVDVGEMSQDDSIRVAMAKSLGIEYRNQVFFSYAAIEKAVTLSSRYMHDRSLPASALDALRESAVLARKARGEHTFVSAEDVARVIHDKTNVPVEQVTQDESSKLLALEEKLHGRVVGQEAAVTAVAQAMRRARAELREGKRPIANFLFMGPTGVGKTETAKALAAEYFGSEKAMIRLDMSEYQEAGSASRMIGEDNDERGGVLTEAVRKNPFSIVLLDEMEKAHPDILNLFLQVMDDGRLTDGAGRTIDFTNVVLIATSNAGTAYIQDEVKKGTDVEQIKTALMERELKGTFRPEFLNRFDAIIVFKPLSMDDVVQIAWLLLNSVGAQLDTKGIHWRAEDAAVEKLAQLGFDPSFGARPLRRVIQDRVDNLLADLILRKAVNRRDTVVLKEDLTLGVEKAKELGT
jgi:ATP-dependent Clp protease ATP-binding subunit ClpC